MRVHLSRVWELTAEELMTENPQSLREDATIAEATSFLIDKGFRAAPVVDKSGRPVGVISQSDIVVHDREKGAGSSHDFYRVESLALETGESGAGPLVRDLMTPAVFQTPPDAPFLRVLEEMVTLNVHRLFVVADDGVLVGVITTLDLLRRLYAEANRAPAELLASR